MGATSTHRNDWNWWPNSTNRRTGYDAYIDRYAAQYRVDPIFVRASSRSNPISILAASPTKVREG